MAAAFIRFENGRLVQQTELAVKPTTRIMSILGKARMGKSTFLNTIASFLENRNCAPFATQDDIDHCTRGVDYYYVSEKDILLLDCQGLAWEDSQNDHKLLLLIYSISDLIIFNERMMLQNEALKLLEPICTFLHYIDRVDDTTKPRLVFRISDGALVKSPKANLDKVLASYKDAYQSIRESIQLLFHPGICAVKTNGITAELVELLEAANYYGVIERNMCGFRSAIEEIMEGFPSERVISPLTQIPRTIAQINNNEKITIEKLDIVRLTSESDIRQWKSDNVPKYMYKSIRVDGTQALYDKHVIPRLEAIDQVLASYATRFRSLPESITQPYRDEMKAEFMVQVDDAHSVCMQKALEIVQPYETAAKATRRVGVFTCMPTSFTALPSSYVKDIMPELVTLEQVCETLYAPVRDTKMAWVSSVYYNVRTTIDEIVIKEREEKETAEKVCNEFVEQFVETCLWLPLPANALKTLNSSIIEGRRQKTMQDIIQCIQCTVKRRQLAIDFVNGDVKIYVNEIAYDEATLRSYDLVADMIKGLEEALSKIIREDDRLDRNLVEKKEELLLNKIVDANVIPAINPEIQFVYYSQTDGWHPSIGQVTTHDYAGYQQTTIRCISLATHNTSFKKVYDATAKRIVDEGFCTEEKATELVELLSVGFQNVRQYGLKHFNRTTYMNGENADITVADYEETLRKIWSDIAPKEFCKAYVAGLIPSMQLLS